MNSVSFICFVEEEDTPIPEEFDNAHPVAVVGDELEQVEGLVRGVHLEV